MASHSKEIILEKLKEASTRSRWGALFALDRTVINLMLREQFLQAIGDLSALEPVSLEADIDDGGSLKVSFQGLVFGAPQVSFETANLFSSNLTVRLPVIAGDYLRVNHLPGSPKRVVESFSIAEGMGYWVQAQLPLTVEQLNSSRFASLVLDLASATRFSSNLGPTAYANQMIGERLREPLGYMHAYQRKYVFARFRLDDYYPLSPDRFMLRTLRAPWGGDPKTTRYGDGAVMLFMKLGTDLYAGSQPDPAQDFIYPIPEEEAGMPGTLICDPDIESLGAGEPLDILKTLQLGNGYKFVSADSQKPLDRVLFGRWQGSEQTVVVEPAMSHIVSGQRQPYIAKCAPAGVQWSARNLTRPGATGTFEQATYSPLAATHFAEEQQRVLVTATFPQGGGEGQRHALLMETARAIQVAPRVATWAQGNSPIELRATDADGGELEWSLVGAVRLLSGPQRSEQIAEDLGKLEDLGNGRARFTPNSPPAGRPDIRIQRIKVANRQSGASAECSVVIIQWAASLNLEPFHVPQRQSVQPTQFQAITENSVSWSVYGEGIVDRLTGLYQPPAEAVMPIAVVAADDGDERTGYAIVEFSEGRRASASLMSWTAISTFEIKAISAPQCFANGWQQIEVEVAVAAADGPGGEPIEISDEDLATLRFLDLTDNEPLVFLAPDEEALDPFLNKNWAVNLNGNTIERQPGTAGTPDVPMGQVRRRRFFLHCRKAGVKSIYATIQNTETFRFASSKDAGEHGVLKLTGVKVPSFTQQAYSFVRTRVAGDESPSDGDEFAYVDNSTDYWRLEHVLREGKLVKFARLRILSGDNKSSVLWASDLLDDHYCSYTGFTFNAADGSSNDSLLFDGLLYQMAKQRTHTLPKLLENHRPGPGQLTFSLHRLDNFRYGAGAGSGLPYISALKKPLLVELIDTEGNAHPLRFVFGVDSEDKTKGISERDKLQLFLR
ncbi:hypothetical protein ACIP1G_26685 [Pseudomonas sp. NPDC089392]|uniref:hypothetical protein n=1 Tax=Pseudomonas sp. NPDC089392 TaxID=3364459 RepID=UPI0038127941